jgi:dTDP-4-amino-4,6-dideoxygalactose transaminase
LTPEKYLVPMSSPDITEEDLRAVEQVLRSRYLSLGPKIVEFEDAFRRYTGSRHAIGVSSGTSGLHLCVRAAGIQRGDWVITTPFSFVSSANVILFEGAVPVFVDVDPVTGNIDCDQVEQAARDLSSSRRADRENWLPRVRRNQEGKLRAILAVDVFGQPADYDTLRPIANRHGLALIEDSCESLGALYQSRKAGTLGDYGVFAFYPNKQITSAEGGMIVTNDDQAADLMRALRNQGRAPGDTWLQHTYLGYNYRLNELSAVLGLSQLGRVEDLLTRRQAVAERYNRNLASVTGVEIPRVLPQTTRMSWFVYVIRLQPSINRDQTAANLEQAGIPVRPYFLPIHLQPYMVERFGYRAGDFPITEDLGRRSLALPFSSVMTEDQIDLVCEKLPGCLSFEG